MTCAFKPQLKITTRSSLNMMNNIPPSQYVRLSSGGPLGNSYTYSEFVDKLTHKAIDGISFLNDGKTAIVIDSTDGDITSQNLHYVHILPNSYEYIMNIANNGHVNVDMFDKPYDILDTVFSFLSQGAMFCGMYYLIALLIRSIFMNGSSNVNMLPGGVNLKSNNVIDTTKMNITFNDVAGCDEAKYELQEVVEFLKDPKPFNDMGAKIPKGVLLEGNPGTGKTLLAKAVACEANVPFLSASGSEFIEMYVGVGASRVRKLFEAAKENAPCVVFIDEIDAVGRQRGAGIAGGNDEREQTLNQILTNMDGFEENSGIVVLAATNRLDILDNALTRPGRFDRKIKVTLPDYDGRKQIANVHFRNKILNNDLDFDELASLTTGFSGADIANLANEAAIYSVRNNLTEINRQSFLDAYEKVTIGLNSYTQENNPEIVNLVACHETGHALMVVLFPQFFDVRKVTINANKNGAGGYTLFTPKEKYTKYATKKFLLANLIIALGGRAAEVYLNKNEYKTNLFDKHVFKGIDNLDITTGASNDLLQANRIAKDYITKYGFGELFGLCNNIDCDKPFVGREMGIPENRLSDNIKKDIDTQVAQLVDFAYTSALELIELHEESFKEIVELLTEKRIITGDDVKYIVYKYSDKESFDIDIETPLNK
jgi:cell division protease FtsH